MKSIVTQLESDEALLLLYAAGELPEQDRVLVDRRLEQDAALRAQLEALQASIAAVGRRLDASAQPDQMSVERAIRRATSAMHSRQVADRDQERQVVEAASWRIPTWVYPAAAAAALLVGVSVYLANVQPGDARRAQRQLPPDTRELVALLTAPPAEIDPLAAQDVAENLAATFDDSEWVLADVLAGEGLAGAAAELSEIQQLALDDTGLDVVR